MHPLVRFKNLDLAAQPAVPGFARRCPGGRLKPGGIQAFYLTRRSKGRHSLGKPNSLKLLLVAAMGRLIGSLYI